MLEDTNSLDGAQIKSHAKTLHQMGILLPSYQIVGLTHNTVQLFWSIWNSLIHVNLPYICLLI